MFQPLLSTQVGRSQIVPAIPKAAIGERTRDYRSAPNDVSRSPNYIAEEWRHSDGRTNATAFDALGKADNLRFVTSAVPPLAAYDGAYRYAYSLQAR
jgi:hypothetical protein